MAPQEINLEGFDELYGQDDQSSEEGAWMDVPGKEGWRIRLRSQNSLKVRNLAMKLNRKHIGLLQANQLPTAEIRQKDDIELMARIIVSAWEGFGGNPCTPDNVRSVMTQYPRFMEVCLAFANERDNYRKADVEAIKGNS